MPNIKDWKPAERVAVLVFGSFKSGKTVGAATFPRPNILDFDRGIASVGSKFFNETFGNRSIEYQTFIEKDKTAQGVVNVPTAFDAACKYFDEWMKPGKRELFDTWIIDSGTTLSEVAEHKAIYLLGGKMPGIKSETHKNAMTHGLIVPKLQDFGAERSLTEQFISMVLDTDKHVVLLCHEAAEQKEDGTIEAIGPMFTGKSRQNIPLKFDEVYRLQVKRKGPNFVRELMTQPDGVSRVGTRMGVPNGTEWHWDALNKALGILKEK